MMVYKFLCLIFHLSLRLFPCESVADFSEIKESDGNLIIRSSHDKNISFETDAHCDVFINKANFAKAVSTINRVDDVMEDYKTVLSSNIVRLHMLRVLSIYIVKPKIAALESSLKKFKQSSSNPNIEIQYLKEEISDIRTSVGQLKASLSKNECAGSPCKHGGTCQDLFRGFHCSCASGWEGLTCEKDVDECARFVSTDLGCQNGGICRNKPGSYECICTNGWHGLHCTTKKTDCFSGPSSEICGHGICIPQYNELGRKCICDQGWKLDSESGTCIQDVDECKEETPVCSKDPLVSCENTPGSFRCGPCPAGFTGNGQYCADINECEIFNGGCSLNPKVQCINTPGSRKCGFCPPGYREDGTTCIYQGVCKTNNGNCHPLATCVEYPSISYSYAECRCPPGYRGNGYGPRGCLPSTITPCSPNPCKFGRCLVAPNSIEGFRCICQGNYVGKYCNESVGPCSSNPCENGGLCVNSNSSSYSCICPEDFTGKRCQIPERECGDLGMLESGQLIYPRDATSYLSCSWNFYTEENKVFNISFSEFDVGKDDDCTTDYIQISEGNSEESNNLGKFCGKQLPKGGRIISTKNRITIDFKATSRSSHFSIKWESVQPSCHEILNLTANKTGSIKSPNWPNNYPLNRDCVWLLQAPAGRSIKLTFFSFDIGNDTDCTGDYLKISSSFVEGRDWLAKKCGGPIPGQIVSEGPEMRIHFHSNKEKSHRGFQINYSLQPACGMLMEDASGTIVSPNVTKDLICFYQIRHNLELKTKLTFNNLSVRNSVGCTEEYVAIYEVFNSSGPLIGRYCGEPVPSPYISDSGVIYIKFKKARASSYFSLSYEAVCEGIFEDPVGYIRSVGYPNPLPVGLTCIYLIKQKPELLITLQMSSSQDYMYYDECESSFLELRDGDNENATLLDSPEDYDYEDSTIYSSSNSLWIKLSATSSECTSSFIANYSTSSGCVTLLRNNTGSITFSNSRRIKKNCKWILQAPVGFFIQLYVTLLDFHSSYQCSLSHVNVYENSSNSKDAKLIGSYCGKRIPSQFLIPSNLATITIASGGVDKDQEFSANYIFLNESKVCGGGFFSKTGTIKSPRYPRPYSASSDCTWTITVDNQHQIELETKVFRLRVPCTMEYLEIRNGGSAFSPLIGRFCGTRIPKTIRSHTNQLYLHLVSLSYVSVDYSKFMFTWETTTTGCGGTLTSATGAIASPNYPEPYNSLTECQWSIIVSRGSKIQVVFLDMDLETMKFYKKCRLDYLEVFDGSSKGAKSLGRFCGTTLPQILVSTNRRMDVFFKSDLSNEGRGFNLHYRTICSNNFTGYGGVIESPNFPERYAQVQECTWHIKVARKNTVNITFSHFDLEEKGYHEFPFYTLQPGIHINYLKVIYKKNDGDNMEEEQYVGFKTFVGSKIPDSVTVPSDHVMLQFKSDTNLLGIGFRLEWVVNGCGGHLNKPGTITSPNYPKKYPDDIECEWLIEAPVGQSVVIKFTFVDVEKQRSCPYDVIKVFNGPDSTYPMLGSLCHMEKKIKFTSNGHFMHVSFASDSSYAGKGFSADIEFVNSKCGGEISASSGTISSPNYPNNFDIGDYCEWLIIVDENHSIDFAFETFDLVSSANCINNYVEIFDGPTTMSASLTRLCEATNATFTSSSNKMLVVFKSKKPEKKSTWRDTLSSDGLTSQGFKAAYSKSCGARLKVIDASGTLKLSPFSMLHSAIETKCAWTIVAPNPGQRVALTVTRLHMQSVDASSQTGLTVYGGESSKSPLIGEYFTNKLPPTIVSSGSALHVVVTPDVDFFAIYHIYGANCGGTLTGLYGMFSPIGTACEWTLQVAPGNEVSVSFKNLNIPSSEKCGLDYLEIREKNATGALKGIFCGDKKPGELTHQGSLWFYFKTEKDNGTYKSSPVGFLAEYATSTSVTVTGFRGKIASPLYPDSFSSSVPFTWKINVPGLSRILLEFEDFQTENFGDDYCLTPYLKVFDGENAEAPELGTFCGINKPDRLESSSNNLFIEALMDSSRLDNRFLLKWTRIYYQKRPVVNKTCGSESIIDIGKIHKYNLTSPGYPYGYAPNLRCEWTFQTENTNSLRIKINSVSMFGYSNFCFHDYVLLTSDDLNKKVCHRVHLRTYNASRTLKVTFIANSYRNGSGFAAEIFEACGGVFTDDSGVITFDADSPRDWTCKWRITVKTGRRISLEFLKFNTNSSNRCDNFITLKNGINSSSPNLGDGKFCERPPVLKTTGNNLYIEFTGNPNRTEFKAVYREILYDCGGSFALNEKMKSMQIMSPNHPNQSEPFVECFWVIRSPPGTYLQVDFIGKFDFHHHSDCDIEGVELRDGGTHLSPLINTFCETSPNTQYTTDNILYVKYFTRVKEPGDGFSATVSIASCGGTYKSADGEIKWSWSPGQPHIHSNCTWNIIAPTYDSLSLEIILEGLKMSAFSCRMNGRLAVYEVSDEPYTSKSKKLLADMCDSSQNKKVTSVSNRVTIEFTNIMNSFKYADRISISIKYNHTGKECSYVSNTEFGTIKSPNYPNLNYFQGFCIFTINVPKGRRITVNITDFDLEKYSATSIDGQSIVFLDYGEYFMEEFFYNTTRRIFKSSGNVLQVIFLSEQSTTHRGFSAHYTSDEETVCTQDFTRQSGSISRLPNNLRYVCIYKQVQKMPINNTLALTISSNLTYKASPSLDLFKKSSISVKTEPYAEFSFGATLFSTKRPLLQPAIIRSVYPEIFLEIQMKDSEGNFSIDYAHHPCGGFIQNDTGYIKTPGFPHRYMKPLECAWIIELPVIDRIKLDFLSMNLGEDCEKSYVEVYNGKYSSSPRIGRFCNTNKPGLIVSQRNFLLIEYHHDGSSSAIGFNASYDSFTEGCGGTITDKYKFIETPNYPNDYPNNAECRWIIVAPEGSHMSLRSVGRFQLEESSGCENDYVEIFDWKNEEWVSIRKWCGRQSPVVTSRGNKLLLVFRSNDKISGSGFQMKWQMKCGGTFKATSEKQYITSPGYPQKYDNNLACSYYIYGRDKLAIEFEDFALEGDYPTCTNDNVTIVSSSRFNIYCGQMKPPRLEARFNVFIKFKSDVYISDSGFKFSFKTDECGENIREPKTIVRTLRNSTTRNYIRDSCLWNITAPKNKIIMFKFSNYSEIPSYLSCIGNVLEIYDSSKFDNLLAKICGAENLQIPVISSSSNTALLSMKTTDIGQISFVVDIDFTPGPEEGCGGLFKLNQTKLIRSPKNFTNADCQWKFEVTEGYKIGFKVETMKLSGDCGQSRTHGSKKCTCSFIEIRDGAGPFSEEIDQFCSNNTDYTQVYTTTGRLGFVRFYTETEYLDEAFVISVRPIQDICGKRQYTASDQIRTITSPGYPGPYDANLRCRWTITKWNFRENIVVRFTEFDLTNSTQHEDRNFCSGDRVEIDESFKRSSNEGKSKTFSTKGYPSSFEFGKDETMQFCGKRLKQFTIHSRKTAIHIGFISTSEPDKGRGFKMEYFLSGCSNNFTQDYGTISASQTNHTNCMIYVTSSENTTLSLYFNTFWQGYMSNCTKESLEIYDGHSKQSNRLLRFCGHVNPNPVFGNTNKMLIILASSSVHAYSSLDATFLASSNGIGCGGKFFGQSGTISSPMYPNKYTNDSVCIWELNVPLGAHIKADFLSFRIKGPCETNYLKVATYENGTVNERTFCETDRIAKLYSANKMTLTYKSSVLNTGIGWLMRFSRSTSRFIRNSYPPLPRFGPTGIHGHRFSTPIIGMG